MRVGVLASGSGSNLQALLDRFNLGDDLWARVAIVVGSRSGIGALDRARAAAVPVAIVPPPGPDSPVRPEVVRAPFWSGVILTVSFFSPSALPTRNISFTRRLPRPSCLKSDDTSTRISPMWRVQSA